MSGNNLLNRGISQAIFEGFFIQRWNDRIRTVNLVEADIHSAKLMISLFLGTKIEESGREVNWIKVVDYGVYSALVKYATSDISSYIHNILKSSGEVYNSAIKKILIKRYSDLLPTDFVDELISYATDGNKESQSMEYQLLSLSHRHALSMEIMIVKSLGYGSFFLDHEEPEEGTTEAIDKLHEQLGLQEILDEGTPSYNEFVLLKKLIDRLRYQIRWSQTPRIPQTSVLGHSFYVATAGYLLIRRRYSEPRVTNNFYACLMHDFLESLTRDIISPVKNSSPELIKEIARIEEEILNNHLLTKFSGKYKDKLSSLLTDEFKDRSIEDPKIVDFASIAEDKKIDGSIVQAIDYYAALLEAHQSIDLGISSHHLAGAIANLYHSFKSKESKFSDREIYDDILKLYDSYISR